MFGAAAVLTAAGADDWRPAEPLGGGPGSDAEWNELER